jgi:hypothetical protein
LRGGGWRLACWTTVDPTLAVNCAVNSVLWSPSTAWLRCQGLCWTMLYYYQGCPSWSWYYAYHYTPMASDIHGLSQLSLFFEQAPHWHRHWHRTARTALARHATLRHCGNTARRRRPHIVLRLVLLPSRHMFSVASCRLLRAALLQRCSDPVMVILRTNEPVRSACRASRSRRSSS